jgi:hypothetical protein
MLANPALTLPLMWITIVPGVGLATGPAFIVACELLLSLDIASEALGSRVTICPSVGLGGAGVCAFATTQTPPAQQAATPVSSTFRITPSLCRANRRQHWVCGRFFLDVDCDRLVISVQVFALFQTLS